MKQFYGYGKAEQKDDAITNVLLAIFTMVVFLAIGLIIGRNL